MLDEVRCLPAASLSCSITSSPPLLSSSSANACFLALSFFYLQYPLPVSPPLLSSSPPALICLSFPGRLP
eukprot:764690-Hanusia_phi.AAC.2